MTKQEYQAGHDFWNNTTKKPEDIITEETVRDYWFFAVKPPVWSRSKDYYQKNLEKLSQTEENNRKFNPDPLDDDFLRKYILPKLPKAEKDSLDILEIKNNWRNRTWWYYNFNNVFEIIDNMYVKVKVKENLIASVYLPKGIYHSWLTRLIQIINTFSSETFLSKQLPDLVLDLENHLTIHKGIATQDENLPDFKLKSDSYKNLFVELKVCTEKGFECYKAALGDKDTFYEALKNDYHAKSDIIVRGALYLIKGEKLKLYSIDLTSYKAAQTFQDITNLVDLSKLKLILSDDNGKIPREDWPVLPLSLMFGLKATWLKNNNK